MPKYSELATSSMELMLLTNGTKWVKNSNRFSGEVMSFEDILRFTLVNRELR
jgi:hypothetical protein